MEAREKIQELFNTEDLANQKLAMMLCESQGVDKISIISGYVWQCLENFGPIKDPWWRAELPFKELLIVYQAESVFCVLIDGGYYSRGHKITDRPRLRVWLRKKLRGIPLTLKGD